MARHKVPIPLTTPDTLLLNMTARQTLILALGGTLAYSLVSRVWSNALLLAGAISVALLILIVTFLVAFVTLKKRNLDVWAIVLLSYFFLPKYYAWRPLPPETTRGSHIRWIALAQEWEPEAED
jgi:hypothetical protein